MTSDYNYYAMESSYDKDKRVDGYGMQRLYDKFHRKIDCFVIYNYIFNSICV